MRHGGGADQTAAPQGPCPLPSRARRTGIESRDEERKKEFVERSLWAAEPREGASEPAVDTCLSPVWNRGGAADFGGSLCYLVWLFTCLTRFLCVG